MERKKAVVDASVCAKWFLNEDYSEAARLVRDSFATGSLSLSVPSLLFYQTLNALKYSRLYNDRELVQAAESPSLALKFGSPEERSTAKQLISA